MTPDDDLDDLRAALDAAAPRPDPVARAAHLRLARESFERLQGAARDARPSPERPLGGVWRGAGEMLNALTTRGGLTATTALVACGMLVLTPAGREVWQGSLGRGEATGPVASSAAREGSAEVAPARQPDALAPNPDDPMLSRTMAAGAEVMEAAPAEPEGDGATPAASLEVMPPEPLPRPAAPVWILPPEETTDELLQALPGEGGDAAAMAAPEPSLAPLPSTEAFANEDPSPLKVTAEEPVSTFSIDVDTASYAVVRQSLLSGVLPPPEAVRVEEMVNYFPYDWPAPEAGEGPFRPTASVMPTPWNPGTRLVAIAIQGERPALDDRPPLNLVFLIDISGSMEDASKLPLLRRSLGLMVDRLRPGDQVAVVTYAGSAGLALPPTPASDRDAIRAALDGLAAGGPTNGRGGLEQAYDVARGMTAEGEVSRVILATDGDFNLGLSDPEALEGYIAREREGGVFLSVLGFGRGNLDDATMQALAQNGNGRAAYIDSLQEAQKVLADQLVGELFPIAQDVKVQVEWNPAAVAEYRLIGYETRTLRREDFSNDRVDAGELGAGHGVTALYEVTPVGSPAQLTEPLRYGPGTVRAEASGELGFLRLRWKEPGGARSELLETPIAGEEAPGTEARFAAAIAGWGQLLRGGEYLGDWGHDDAIALADANRGDDPFGYRAEAVRLMRLAQSLSGR